MRKKPKSRHPSAAIPAEPAEASKSVGPASATVPADSAGVPWAGRHFEENNFDGDDGSAPPALFRALESFHASDGNRGGNDQGSNPRDEAGNPQGNEADIIDALRGARLLIPLVARLGESGVNEEGLTVDKSAELAIVTVTGPDGRTVLPVFSSVDALSRWNSTARPVPVTAERVALAAASEQTDLVVLDPTSLSEYVIRRPALWAIAQSLPWQPCYLADEVRAVFEQAAQREPSVVAIQLAAGDPSGRLLGPELIVRLELVEGLSRDELDGVLGRMQAEWAASDVIAARVDSMKVQLIASV